MTAMPKIEFCFVLWDVGEGYRAADVLPSEVDPPPADWLASISRGNRPERHCSCQAEVRSDADGDASSSEN